MDFKTEFDQHIKAGARGFWVTTHEEERVLPEVTSLLRRSPTYQWSLPRGLRDLKTGEIIEPADGGLGGALSKLLNDPPIQEPWWLLLCDPHEHLAAGTKRMIRELLMGEDARIIIISPKFDIPTELTKQIIPLNFQLPTEAQLIAKLSEVLDEKASKSEIEVLADASVGLTMTEAPVYVKLARIRHRTVQDAAQEIWAAKSKIWAQRGLVASVARPTDTWDDVGGLKEFKRDIEKRLWAFSKEARDAGKPQPRGAFFCGGPGVGKTLISRAIAAKIGWNFIKVDLGRLLGPLVGTSEANTRDLIVLFDALHPAVIQLDEAAHQMAGHASELDSGVMSRVVQQLLTWLEERPYGTYVVGSTNEPWRLPVHILRSGRFDNIWHVSYPKAPTLTDIALIHAKRLGVEHLVRNEETKNLAMHMERQKFAGAEVEHTLIDVVQVAGRNKPTFKQWEEAVHSKITTASMQHENVKRLEEWAKQARDAA